MRVLVTGVAGFIGSSIAERLLKDGVDVVGLDCFTDYYAEHLKRENVARLRHPRFQLIETDLATESLERLVRNFDAIYHQAGQPGVRGSWGDNFSTYTRNNVETTQRLLEAARSAGRLRRFVYASSSSIYGDAPTFPTSEEALPLPQSPYGVTKLAGEHLCSLYASNFDVPTVSFRYFTVYGPRQRPDMAFTRFCKAALGDGEIQIYGDGEQVRDFTYIDDIVDANVAALDLDLPSGVVMNLSGGTHASVNESLGIVAALAGHELNIVRRDSVHGDVRRTGGSSRRAQELLNWRPQVSLREGLARQLAWFSNPDGES